MINEKGERIVSVEEEKNLDFILAEIKFMTKTFRIHKTDNTAWDAAKKMKEYLSCKGNIKSIEEWLAELETYSLNAQSESFVWELVYIRRSMSDIYRLSTGYTKDCAESKLISAKLFERICKINPSHHNFLCRVREYLSAIELFRKTKVKGMEKAKVDEIMLYTVSLFENLENDGGIAICLTGSKLYADKFFYYDSEKSSEGECAETLAKLIFYLRNTYSYFEDDEDLELLANVYLIYMTYEQFSYNEKEQELNELIGWVEKLVDCGYNRFRKVLEELKTARDKLL
ncbi:MAG: hypothetical protein IJ275_06310 [Ruminococcus sp.]|nr:hypothetical protein [Ruminococcus sp.]